MGSRAKKASRQGIPGLGFRPFPNPSWAPRTALGVFASLLLFASCGTFDRMPAEHRLTQKRMRALGGALNQYLADNALGGYVFPKSLQDAKGATGLPREDGWGQALVYERLGGDRYRLLSAGSDRTWGTDDDLVMENLVFYPPRFAYGRRPPPEGD